MPENWKTYNLEAILQIKNGKTKPKNLGDIPIYGGNGILGFGNKSNLSEEAILIGRVGAYCGAVYYENREVWVSDNSLYGIAKTDFETKFIYYLLKWADLNRYSTGSSQPLLTQRALNRLEFRIPGTIEEQISIASILSALDDKIELNLQMNQTLEEMAMALYKQWFFDFGPFQDGEFVDSELGEIPKGWEVKKLKEFAELIMGQSPKSQFYNDRQDGLPFHQGVKDYGIRFPTDITYSTAGNREAAKGDILFSVRAPVGRLNVAKNKIILGRGLAAIRMPKFNSFLFYALKRMFTTEDSIGSGTVFNSVNKSDLQNLKFVLPPEDQLLNFTNLVDPLDQQYLNNSTENETLTQLRDTLLPKLISGEVRVKDVEKTLSEVS